MTNTDFARVVAYITAGCGKTLTAEQQVVYFDCLGDLDAETFQLAAKRVLMEHKWATFPSIAELRKASALTRQGTVTALSAIEAWEKAWGAVACIDLDIDGSVHKYTHHLPKLVRDTMHAVGIVSLVEGKDPVPVVRAQFLAAYQQLLDREERRALMPQKLVDAIESTKRLADTHPTIAGALDGIGKPME